MRFRYQISDNLVRWEDHLGCDTAGCCEAGPAEAAIARIVEIDRSLSNGYISKRVSREYSLDLQ
jgi:hypothetical protein